MREYTRTVGVTREELDLFKPIGDQFGGGVAYSGPSLEELDKSFTAIREELISWSYGAQSTAPWLDRCFTVHFDDDHVFDILWTYYDQEGNGDNHWYFGGVRYGTRDDVLVDYDGCTAEGELISHPEDSVEGEYVYRVGDDTYTIVIEEA